MQYCIDTVENTSSANIIQVKGQHVMIHMLNVIVKAISACMYVCMYVCI